MILKQDLQNIISKYYLNALVEAVRWDIKDNNLTINFTSPDRTMIGTVWYKGIELEDSEIGISNTTQLNKLLSVTSGYLNLDYIKEKKSINKLIIVDQQFTLNYALADLMIIPKAGKYVGMGQYHIEAPLDNDTINAIVKAKTALTETDTVVIQSLINADKQLELELIFGGNIEYSNKISFTIPNIETNNVENGFKVNYDSNLIKEIMSCNKDSTNGKMKIDLNGVMELSFDGGNIKSQYFIVAKDN